MIADQTGRYTAFSQALINLRSPVNTALDWELGSDRGRSRNNLVKRSFERGSEWILFIDDDHSFNPNLLMGLLAHEQPVVASLYIQRVDPFYPIAFADKDEEGNYWPLDLSQCGPTGLVQVRGAGTGGMLIRTEVFDQIPDPWFVHTTEQSEDLYFCDRLAEHGIPLYVDLEARLGHLAVFNCVPEHEEPHGWAASISISPTMKVVLPIGQTPEE